MITNRSLLRLAASVVTAIAFPAFVAAGSSGNLPAPKLAHRSSSTGKSPVTISLTSSVRHGNLVVSVDDVPVFNEEFHKPMFLISQTTTWDPLQVAAGKHKLTAKVCGANGKTYLSAEYDLELSRTKGIELRFRTRSSGLTLEPAS